MRTTVELPDDLLRKAKRVALERETTLKELIARGLEYAVREAAGKDATNRPDSKRLPKVPRRGRKRYAMSDGDIEALFASEEERWYGSAR
jgi:hypothetical protein